jgi:hypothetical protein
VKRQLLNKQSASSESVPDLLSRLDEIIKETDEIDDASRFMLDDTFDIKAFEFSQCDCKIIMITLNEAKSLCSKV